MIKGAAYKTKVLFYEVRIIETPLNYQHLFRRRSTEMLKQRIPLGTDIAVPTILAESSHIRMNGQMVVMVKAKLIERQRRKELAILDKVRLSHDMAYDQRIAIICGCACYCSRTAGCIRVILIFLIDSKFCHVLSPITASGEASKWIPQKIVTKRKFCPFAPQ